MNNFINTYYNGSRNNYSSPNSPITSNEKNTDFLTIREDNEIIQNNFQYKEGNATQQYNSYQ
ncbi:MAG: hypothetical protein GY821_11715 [Gammaproteobacteria bacterium]|nr:hypothetical protein [Gammaproteobacteria bacterium]